MTFSMYILTDHDVTTDIQTTLPTTPLPETEPDIPFSTMFPLAVNLSDSGNTQIAGENYTLTCQVTGGGTRTPTYRWFKDGAQLTGQTTESLSFSPLRQIDSGTYTCDGTRSSVTRRSTSVSLTVVGK